MTQQRLDAVAVSDRVRDAYLTYLQTLLSIRDEPIEQALRAAITEERMLVTGPVLEASPPYEPGCSLAELIQQGVLSPWLRRLGHPHGLPLDRPLYRHQEQAIRKAVAGRNLVIATGTGSGKTEGFLVPVLHHLARQAEDATLDRPGVRALLLYPMNALANDQMLRLRNLLREVPEVTLGRYIGETRRTHRDALEQFHRQFPGVTPPDNELLSREEMQERPPHLLITNYAMLEYLLLRPHDHTLFDGDAAQWWRFLVLDEAHVYDGAQGIEVAMLLRRLRDRVARDADLQCIATSATVGGAEAGAEVTEFATQLFDAPFEYRPDDPNQQDVVWATRRAADAVGDTWGPLPDGAYRDLLDAKDRQVALARFEGAPTDAPTFAAALVREQRVHLLRRLLAEGPRPLEEVAAQLFDGDDARERTEELVALGASTHDRDDLPLVPARYHLWARATEGAYVCLSEEEPHVWLTRHEICGRCGSACFEVGSCQRCSVTYLTGTFEGDRLVPRRSRDDRPSWFVLADGVDADRVAVDEDDETLEPIEAAGSQGVATRWLCTRCGRVHDEEPAVRCGHDCSGTSFRRLLDTERHGKRLHTCPICGGRSSHGQVRLFESGSEAAVAVLTTAVYQDLPPDQDPQRAHKPGGGRKVLLFSDSRQDAAYFAPYLERTYEQLLRRRCVLEGLATTTQWEPEVLLEDLAEGTAQATRGYGLFGWSESRTAVRRRTATWVHAELLSVVATNSLEGLAVVAFGHRRNPSWPAPQPLLDLGLTPDEAWGLTTELLRTLRTQGAVTFPEGVASDDEAFEPRTGPIYVRLAGPERKRKVMSWLPASGTNTRISYIGRLLSAVGGDPGRAEATAEGIWKWLTQGAPKEWMRALSDPALGVVWQLNHEYLTARLVTADHPVFRCTVCQRLAPTSVRGVCTTIHCSGELRPWAPPDASQDRNHYRRLARDLVPLPMAAKEHTAQWNPQEAATVQQNFLDGNLNALSCSTTFELGVDVGELQAVILRNVPPTTANYVQRAGRAGRRTDSAALVVTYAQRRSHDLTYYQDPTEMIAGRIRPPRVSVDNERIALRHVYSTALAGFFRQVADEGGGEYRTVGDLFRERDDGPPEDQRLIVYIEQVPDEIVAAAKRLVPEALHDRVGLHDGSWARGLIELVRLTGERHRDDVALYRELELKASAEGKYAKASMFQRVIHTLERRYLLNYLASRNLLPKYGFPVDSVELQTAHVPSDAARRLSLDRDLRLAISDYAPGSEIVAGGLLWQSAGIHRLPERDLPVHYFVACRCGAYEEQATPFTIDQCPVCGHQDGLRTSSYIVPEFGFVASSAPPRRPTAKPARIYAGRVFFAGGGAAAEPQQHRLSGARLEVRHVERGELVVINTGPTNAGFYICEWCGAGEPVRGRPSKSHTDPRRGRPCTGPVQARSLGHRFQTDVLELHLLDIPVPRTDGVWWSLLYALIEGAASELQIARDELDGTVHYVGGGPPALIIFDDVPGGAGHVRRIHQSLDRVLSRAYERVAACECGPETSCYRCLRTFSNQLRHDELHRGPVADLLSIVLGPGGVTRRLGQLSDRSAVRDEAPTIATDERETFVVHGEVFVPVAGHGLPQLDGRRVLARLDGHDLVGTMWVETDPEGRVLNVMLVDDSRRLHDVPDLQRLAVTGLRA